MSASASILVVEDDENLGLVLADNLDSEGYEATHVSTLQAARSAVGESAFDLVLLDVMLPDGDGYSFCRELRSQHTSIPVLMLTARTLEEDIVRGFDAGADDYVAKPYRLAELLARVRALLRRGGSVRRSHFRFGEFTLDVDAQKLTKQSTGPVKLTPREFQLLAHFLENQDRALSRDQLIDAVWGREVSVDTRTVDNFVSSLKKKLGWKPGAGYRIQTVRSVGYRMEVEPPNG